MKEIFISAGALKEIAENLQSSAGIIKCFRSAQPMNREDFVTDLAGTLRKTSSDYWTFIPRPLPPAIDYSADLTLLLSKADASLCELSGLGRYLPNPNLLIGPYLRREAVASSRIEGTQADLGDLMRDELDSEQAPLVKDVREVRNYVNAMNLGLRELDRLPLSGRLVCALPDRAQRS